MKQRRRRSTRARMRSNSPAKSSPSNLSAIVVALLALAAACETSRPAGPAAIAARPAEARESLRLGYSWKLPADWEFIPADELPNMPATSSVDVYAAKRKNARRPAVLVMVRDLVAVVPGRVWGDDPKDYQELEQYAVKVLRASGAQVAETRRVRMAGLELVEVNGALPDDRISIRIGYAGRRRFEFRCFGNGRDSPWPCDSALASFRVVEPPPEPQQAATPRLLHLRDSRFGIAFDAPDDSWLAIGPRTGAGGAQVVWIWNKSGRQIDVQALDLSVAANPPDEKAYAAAMATKFREGGATVTVKTAVLAGEPCHHLEIARADGSNQDMFILFANRTSYGVLITQPSRDPNLVEQARKGFRLTSK